MEAYGFTALVYLIFVMMVWGIISSSRKYSK